MESFIKGIDAQRAKGHGQGKGFYVFTKKENAQEHAKGLASGKIYKGMDGGDSHKGDPIVIVINPPLTPQNFDIDYEIFGDAYIKFALQNKEYFYKNRLKLGVGSAREKDTRFLKLADKGRIKFRGKEKSSQTVSVGGEISVMLAQKIGESAELLSVFDPAMHKKFEEQALSKATGLKYNGKEKIIPVRIENADGKILWSRKK
jgi:ribosomal 50S subunit-recycling heat shock protein